MKILKILAVTVMSFLLAGWPALGTLTATWTPGYQFSANERPTTATLNLLGTGSILISGTVDGSTGLTAGSVAGNLLADSVPDGITLNYNGGAPRQLQILPGGVGYSQLNTNVAGRGLSGGWNQASASGTNLNVNYDGVTITLSTNNQLMIAAGFLAGVFFSFPATPNYTNIWGTAQTFLITNFNITVPTNLWFNTTNTWNGTVITTNSTAQALTNTDTIGVQSILQGNTNTVTTLGSVAQFVQSQEQTTGGTYTNLTRMRPTGPGVVAWYWGGATNVATTFTLGAGAVATVWANTNANFAMLVDVGGSFTISSSSTVYLADPNTNSVFVLAGPAAGATFPINRFIVPPHYGVYVKNNGSGSSLAWNFTLLATPY